MFAVHLTSQWAAWVVALAAPLHRRCARRLAHVVAGILMASGRRTASSWWRAAGIGRAYRSHDYFLDAVGRKAAEVATVALGLVLDRVAPEGRLLLAIDDTPTKRYGTEVQGAGVHHNPTPGPAGSKFLYGHSWVVLGRVVHHPHGGAVALPLLGRLYIRDKDIPDLPGDIEWTFRTKPQLAAELITWAGDRLGGPEHRPWVAVDGAYCNRESLRPAKRAGFTIAEGEVMGPPCPDKPLPGGHFGRPVGRGRTSPRGRR